MTAIDVTVFAVTVKFALELTPLVVAVIVAVPAATPVTRPVVFTVATAVFDELQLTVELTLPVDPSLYFAVTLSCSVAPAEILSVAGETVIAVTVFAVTVSIALPLTPFDDAVMLVEPAATPVASPVPFIVATAALAAVQLTVELTFAVVPSLYFDVAVNCCVMPAEILPLDGATVIAANVFAATVSVALPLTTPNAAVTVELPDATPVASPVVFSVATAGSEDVQLTVELTFAVDPSL